jgi:RNA polymerase-binding transcription factor DksA
LATTSTLGTGNAPKEHRGIVEAVAAAAAVAVIAVCEAEKKKQADAITQTLEAAVQKEEKSAQSEACVESETAEETTCKEEEQAGKSGEQESKYETADYMLCENLSHTIPRSRLSSLRCPMKWTL